jgi:hypothetical protein
VKVARVKDEQFREGEVVPTADFGHYLREANFGADLFTFIQKPPATGPVHPYHVEWKNLAVIETRSFENWWEKELPQVTRKNVRRAGRRGVVVRRTECDESFVSGITAIYNEIPIRDGRPFPHYGKNLETVKREVSTMPERSEFLGAYCGDELIGFIKLVHMGKLSSILHIVSKRAHYDKRPSNALLAAAVEACCNRGTDYLIYGQYHYGNRSNGPLTEFKRRNGFKKILVPQYFIPLTLWGKISLALRLHRDVNEMLPTPLVNAILLARSRYYERRLNTFLGVKDVPVGHGEMGKMDLGD